MEARRNLSCTFRWAKIRINRARAMADLPVRVSLHDLLRQIGIIHPDLANASV